ncbi:MAG: MBL fold metallo-hydrolase [Planctomycetes bacterium]|nr:MBL fold metallo-hydrolase [Planctomycetota bacterium]
MEFKQFYLGCLAHASYLVGDAGECAIVDPQRDVEGYIDEAAKRGLVIKHVIETHLHADFVSGHVELARRTGATIHIGAKAGAAFEHHAVHDGDEIVMGAVVLRFLETPGHTPEGVCVLVFDRTRGDQPACVLTGDTLFIGDVGRPDLVGSKGHTAAEMAGLMYDSLHDKLMTLPDDVEVYPAHGAGSACGRNISAELSSTIGRQKELNHALQPMTRDEFVERMTTGLEPPPRYFPHSAELNRQGAPSLGDLPRPPALNPDALERAVHAGARVLDVRTQDAFASGHVPGALNIPLGGNFASWAGTLLDAEQPLVLVAESDAALAEAIVRLARVGMQTLAGFLSGGITSWEVDGRVVRHHPRIDVDELARRMAEDGDLVVLDVRRVGEHVAGHVPGAVNVPLHELEARVGELDPSRPTAVICASGYRSSVACGFLERAGLVNLVDVRDGTNGWIASGHPVEAAAPVG